MRRVLAVALAGLTVACVGKVAQGPPAIKWGVDVCESCGMSISEPRYAGAIAGDLSGEGRIFVFDDLGCLARWETKTLGFVPRERWAHDRNSERWIEAGAAVFVRSGSWTTPMGSGIAAFSTSADPQIGGVPMVWEQVLQMARRGELDVPMPTSAREESP